MEDAEVAINYNITYDNQDVSFFAYTDGENVGLYVKGNGKSAEFISDFRDAALEEPVNAEVSSSAVAIRNFLSS